MSLLRRWQETSWDSTLGAKVAVALLATAAAILLNAGSSWAQTPTSTPVPTGFLQICKQAGTPAVTGNFTFTVAPASGATQTVTVPVGACSTALTLAAGNATITEAGPTSEGQPAFTLTSVTATGATAPTNRLVSQTGNSAVVTIVAGGISTQTIATFTNAATTGQIKVCKVAGAGVTVGTNFTFTVGTATVTVPAGAGPGGNCVIVGGATPTLFPVLSQVSIDETVPTGTNVTSIVVAPATRLVGSPNLAAGQVSITVGTGVTEVTFTDASAATPTNTSTATPTRTATPTLSTSAALAATLTAVATAASPTPAGTPGVPCASQANQVCTISSPFTGGPTGTATNTGGGGFTFNLTATAPATTVAGDIPLVFISTTVGQESSLNSGFVCSAVTGAGAVTTCSGTTRGLILQGAGVLVRFVDTTLLDLAGNVFGCATACAQVGVVPPPPPPVGLPPAVPQVGIPAVPRPPVQFIPSAPAPLLPPTGQLQGLQGAPVAPPRYPEVPVIPETDSLALILGGLATIGAVALYRRRRN